MAKNEVVYEMYATYEIMRNRKPVPASRPADFISLTPVVIPMPIMPYMVKSPQKPKAAPDAGDAAKTNAAQNAQKGKR